MYAEGSDIGTSLATDPEDTHISLFVVLKKLSLVNSSDSKLFLNCGNERWSLEACSCESFKGLLKLLDLVDLAVQLDNSYVLFTSGLLSLDKSSCIVDTCDKATSDFRIESTTMTSLINLKNSLNPCNDLVTTWV